MTGKLFVDATERAGRIGESRRTVLSGVAGKQWQITRTRLCKARAWLGLNSLKKSFLFQQFCNDRVQQTRRESSNDRVFTTARN